MKKLFILIFLITVFSLIGISGESNVYNVQDTTAIQQEISDFTNAYRDLYNAKVKQLVETDKDLLRIEGIILYLQDRLKKEQEK